MNIQRYALPHASPLTAAYVERSDARVARLYGGHPEEPEDWRRRAAALECGEAPRIAPGELAPVLERYNVRLGASAATRQSIAALGEGAQVVVGGQQAGLWSGPMMTLHKAVSVIAAARHASELLGRTVVPVFWIAGEDHDWEEAAHTYVVDSKPSLTKLHLDRPRGARTSVSRTLIDEGAWRRALRELAEALPDTEHKPTLLAQMETAAASGETLSEVFGALLLQLFAEDGLVVLDADDPELRRLEAPMFARLIARNAELRQAYADAARRLRELGYAPQVETEENCAHLFVYADGPGRGAGERLLLYREADGYADRKGQLRFEERQLAKLAETEPQRFSNNVLTRPLMQDYALPVLATVLGPAEIAYWAMVGDAFGLLGMRMPLVVPRASFTLIDEQERKLLARYGLTYEDVAQRMDEIKAQWLAQAEGELPEEAFARARGRMLDAYEPLLAELTARWPGLSPIAETNRAKLLEQVAYMEQAVGKERERRQETALRQLELLRLTLHPAAGPQERVLSAVYYWNRVGVDWLRQLAAQPFRPRGGHSIVYI
ncbi:bacillithiol biosynthesis cysteine-adding enzyme BshC [Paenibacillus sp. IB182496]|uniref:Putative cysteine ligase BshC n=1 Tax=Paenibacillus sabuli TaxID=2772509 RepID=A0A927GR02_9BACL|nr:bacillithiol biosynthesis cysteine-adding enzyme BshC [Paenibacillus sabuli]MBD2844410.1 bacillithiol biosynthesis cysteine-adding enzyme BshC [Paenibacillus sabuli]